MGALIALAVLGPVAVLAIGLFSIAHAFGRGPLFYGGSK